MFPADVVRYIRSELFDGTQTKSKGRSQDDGRDGTDGQQQMKQHTR